MTCPCQRPSKPTWVLPAIVLALLPKCPLCLVAYASSLGIGLSLGVATTLRELAIVACVLALAFALVRRLRARVCQ